MASGYCCRVPTIKHFRPAKQTELIRRNFSIIPVAVEESAANNRKHEVVVAHEKHVIAASLCGVKIVCRGHGCESLLCLKLSVVHYLTKGRKLYSGSFKCCRLLISEVCSDWLCSSFHVDNLQTHASCSGLLAGKQLNEKLSIFDGVNFSFSCCLTKISSRKLRAQRTALKWKLEGRNKKRTMTERKHHQTRIKNLGSFINGLSVSDYYWYEMGQERGYKKLKVILILSDIFRLGKDLLGIEGIRNLCWLSSLGLQVPTLEICLPTF